MKLFLTNLLLALAWVTLTVDITFANVLLGFVVSHVTLWIIFRHSAGKGYFLKIPLCLQFAWLFLKEVVKSCVEVAIQVVREGKQIEPAIIRLETDISSDLELMFFSSFITLTPGNVVLDYEEDTKVFYIHLLTSRSIEKNRRDLARLEKQIKRLFE